MKALLMVALAAGLFFAAGYIGGRYELSVRAEAAAAAATADAEQTGAAEDGAASSVRPGEEGTEGPHYVEAGQLIVPLLTRGETAAFVMAQVTLEAGDGIEAAVVRRRLLHVRSAMLETLFGLAHSGAFNGPAVDPAAVAAALRTSANEQFSAAPVKTVLIDRLLRQDNTRR